MNAKLFFNLPLYISSDRFNLGLSEELDLHRQFAQSPPLSCAGYTDTQ